MGRFFKKDILLQVQVFRSYYDGSLDFESEKSIVYSGDRRRLEESLHLVPGLGGATGAYSTGVSFAGNMPAFESQASYCPNKTAEMIEEMVKSNPCISKVYLPDKWLINRLNELGDKIVYKPFADDDRFSVEVEKTQCK